MVISNKLPEDETEISTRTPPFMHGLHVYMYMYEKGDSSERKIRAYN